ncbi:MAG: amidase [Halioglobus sp.]
MAGFAQYDEYDGLGLAALVRDGEVSAGELLEEAIARTERVNGRLNAVVHTWYDEAREAVATGVPQGPFAGVPFLLKNLDIAMAGTPMSNGSGAWRDHVCDSDSTLAQRYRQAGLVCFGRSNSPELGLNPVTEPAAFGPTCNPWDTARTPGGSSGGAAAAVASGVVPMAHASDGGGSIRIPASCCALVGLKPSRGRIPMGPTNSEGWAGQTTSHIVSRSVRDTAAMLDATAGPDVGDYYTAPPPAGRFLDAASAAPGTLRIAVCHSKFGPGEFQPEVLKGLQRTIALLEGLGHSVEEARPDFDGEAAASAMFTVICVNTLYTLRERAMALGTTLEQLDIEDGTRLTLALGEGISAPDYLGAVRSNHQLARQLGQFHQRYDVILGPTLSSPPVLTGFIGEAPPEEYGERLFSFMGDTGLYNQTGQPSISLPLAWTDSGLPLGMMFSAAYGNDALLLSLAAQLEDAAPWRGRRPAVHAGEKA